MIREKLRVELKAEELLVEGYRLLKKIRYPTNACTHLEKSLNSVHFNVGEGVVCIKAKVKAEKYDIARREAKEVQKALNALVHDKKLTQQDVALADDLADAIIGMLTNMIKGLEQRM